MYDLRSGKMVKASRKPGRPKSGKPPKVMKTYRLKADYVNKVRALAERLNTTERLIVETALGQFQEVPEDKQIGMVKEELLKELA